MNRYRNFKPKTAIVPAGTTPKQLAEGKILCKATSKKRDAKGNPVLGPDGKALRKPCQRFAIKGGLVCTSHGGKAPQVRKTAEKRWLGLVHPAIEVVRQLLEQTEHRPTQLAAARTVFERAGDVAIGQLKGAAAAADTRPVINIGIKVGGINAPQIATVEPVIDVESAEPTEGDED